MIKRSYLLYCCALSNNKIQKWDGIRGLKKNSLVKSWRTQLNRWQRIIINRTNKLKKSSLKPLLKNVPQYGVNKPCRGSVSVGALPIVWDFVVSHHISDVTWEVFWMMTKLRESSYAFFALRHLSTDDTLLSKEWRLLLKATTVCDEETALSEFLNELLVGKGIDGSIRKWVYPYP